MSAEAQVLAAAAGIVAGGAAGLLPLPGNWPQRVAAALGAAGSALGIAAAAGVLLQGAGPGLRLPWGVPGAEFALRVDPLSAWFLVPVFLIPGLGGGYALEYWRQSEHSRNGRQVVFFYALVTAAMALVVSAHNAVLFLAAWEVMALSAFFLVAAEDEQAPVREAAWIYLVATHACTLLLFGLFALHGWARGSFLLEPFAPGAVAPALANGMFLLALGGFGIKAGLFPLHVWLPPAHAAAPSHVSALMSGVLIKMGVYGMLRVAWLFDAPPGWWGLLLLGLGVASAVLGVAFALGQHDLKRLLAYHSIENIGIIFMGLGMAVAGRAAGEPVWMALGLAGALLHTWNHGLFKALLFLGAGAVLHRAGTREMDRLGGLAKAMPRTALLFLTGAAAICGLPPLNGFVSELLVYVGLFNGLSGADPQRWIPALIALPALGLTGALALACFVKVYGTVFLGTPRSPQAERATECGPAMTLPMAALAACCAAIGLFPALLAPLLERVAAQWAGGRALPALAALTPLPALTPFGLALLAGAGLLLLALGAGRWRRVEPTWDCGFALSTPRVQYTGSSLAQWLVTLWKWVLIPAMHRAPPAGVFPARAHFASHVPDTVLDRAVLPALRGVAWTFSWLRPLQRGDVNAYLFYVFAALILLLILR